MVRPDPDWDFSQDGQSSPGARPPRISGWLIAGLVALALALAALLRYAIDLLAVVCAIWLIGWSLRTMADWFRGGTVEPWTIGAVVSSIVGAALAVDWLARTDVLSPQVARYVPAAVTRTIGSAGGAGWGQRAVLTTPPRPASPPAVDGTPSRGAAPSAHGTEALGGSTSSSPGDRREPKAAETGTVTRLASSQGAARVGTTVRFTATVTALSGQVPRGSVTFRRGSVVMGSTRVGRDGRALIATSDLPPGLHEITAEFSGVAPSAGALPRCHSESPPSDVARLVSSAE
jgi:hypothetical protein